MLEMVVLGILVCPGEKKTWWSLLKLQSVEPLTLPWLLLCKDCKQAKSGFASDEEDFIPEPVMKKWYATLCASRVNETLLLWKPPTFSPVCAHTRMLRVNGNTEGEASFTSI